MWRVIINGITQWLGADSVYCNTGPAQLWLYRGCEAAGEKICCFGRFVFEKTGCLWEKYNVVEGSINVTNEYEMPAMMGWSAGVYLYCADLLK